MNNSILNQAKLNTVNKLNAFGLCHDRFMNELSKYKGVISGSFMFMNLLNAPMKCNDIDIYICDNDYFEKMYQPQESGEINVFHPFETYILENITNNYHSKNSYLFIDGIKYSRVYISKYININFILLNQPCVEYIYQNFDLDCCKIVYDGKNVSVFDLENLLNRKSTVKYNQCCLDHLYAGNSCYTSISQQHPANKYTYLTNSIAYIKFKMLHDVYKFNKGLILDFPIYEHIDCVFTGNNSIKTTKNFCGVQFINLFTNFILQLNKNVNLDQLFNYGSITDFDQIQLTNQIVKVISMIRTLERVEKYRKRGINDFNFTGETQC